MELKLQALDGALENRLDSRNYWCSHYTLALSDIEARRFPCPAAACAVPFAVWSGEEEEGCLWTCDGAQRIVLTWMSSISVASVSVLPVSCSLLRAPVLVPFSDRLCQSLFVRSMIRSWNCNFQKRSLWKRDLIKKMHHRYSLFPGEKIKILKS